jgi:hypothetical protein
VTLIADTNVLSELLRSAPDPRVVAWLSGKALDAVFTTSITQAELLVGVALMPKGRRRTTLDAAVHALLDDDLRDRVLPFDRASARCFAEIVSRRRAAGRPISHSDAQIAAIARATGMRVATRNVADFAGCEIAIDNPWEVSAAP